MRRAIVLGVLAALLTARFFTNEHRIPSPVNAAETASVSMSEPISDSNELNSIEIESRRVARVGAELDSGASIDEIESMAQSVGDADLVATLNRLVGETNSAAGDLRRTLVRRWAESDPASAAAWTATLTGPVHLEALQQVAVAWGNLDLSAAAAWVAGLPEDSAKQVATISLGYEAARTEPMKAITIASATPATPERDELIAQAVSQWAMSDSAAAFEWARQIPDSRLRERSIGAIAVAAARNDGLSAATIVATFLSPGDAQKRAAVSVAHRWAQVSAQSATAWVGQFPDDLLRDSTMREITPTSEVRNNDAGGL